jgi:hypothetical protein
MHAVVSQGALATLGFEIQRRWRIFDDLTIHAKATCNPRNTEGKYFTALPVMGRLN